MTTIQKLLGGSGLAGLALLALVTGGHGVGLAATPATETVVAVPPPTIEKALGQAGPQTLILAGGCFWGVQGTFQHVRGVLNAVSGYDGGAAATADYHTVSTGETGHAEAVRITYDPKVVTYGQLLQVFFSVVTDPTQLGGQFPDRGTEYRSAIFATTPEQVHIANAYIRQVEQAKVFAKPIVTEVVPDTGFFPAEAYHQDYLARNPDSAYIAMFDLPKVAALRKAFPVRFRPVPVLTTSDGS